MRISQEIGHMMLSLSRFFSLLEVLSSQGKISADLYSIQTNHNDMNLESIEHFNPYAFPKVTKHIYPETFK